MDRQAERELRENLYEQFARICKALGSARRLELMDLLSHGEHSVEQLAYETNMSIANTSQHLQLLRASRLVAHRRKGVEIFYRLADQTVFALIQAVQDLAEARLAEVDRIIDQLILEREGIHTISFDQLEQMVDKDSVYLVDVRPTTEYNFSHIPGAVSIPLSDLAEMIKNIPLEKEIVVYCRDYYCMLSDSAIKILAENQIKASRLLPGMAEWKSQGKPDEQFVPAAV